MRNAVKAPLVFAAIVVGIVFVMGVANLCPPQGPWPMPPWCGESQNAVKENIAQTPSESHPAQPSQDDVERKEKKPEILTVDLTVTVPYWTEGDVYIGKGENPAYYKLEKVNDVTYKGTVELENGSSYYYSLGDANARSIDSYTVSKSLVFDAVVDWTNSEKRIAKKNFQKGVTFGAMAWNAYQKQYINESMDRLDEFGVEWIIIIPDWFVFPDKTGTEIKPFYDADTFPNPTGWIEPTLTDEELVSIIRRAKSKGLKVVLKPHVDPIDFGMNEGSNRGSLEPEDWDEWFANYEKFILHYAELAEDEGVDMFVVGTELYTSVTNAPQGEQRWRDIIAKVRNVYSGPLTYSSSCNNDEYCFGPVDVKFWDALDYIGFEPYFGLTDKNDPTIEEMKREFDRKFDKFAKPLYEKYKKPVLLTEVNAYSFDGLNKHPIGPVPENAKPDYQEQADYYEALFQSIESREWIKGTYWWGWFHDSTVIDYNPDDLYDPFVYKPAGQVLKKWYKKIAS